MVELYSIRSPSETVLERCNEYQLGKHFSATGKRLCLSDEAVQVDGTGQFVENLKSRFNCF